MAIDSQQNNGANRIFTDDYFDILYRVSLATQSKKEKSKQYFVMMIVCRTFPTNRVTLFFYSFKICVCVCRLLNSSKVNSYNAISSRYNSFNGVSYADSVKENLYYFMHRKHLQNIHNTYSIVYSYTPPAVASQFMKI